MASDVASYGGVSRGEARSLVRKVSEQMQKAASSIVGLNDPIRRAMRIGMFGQAPTPQQDAVNDAKARLYLYSGLTQQSLKALFRPGPGMLAICTQSLQISETECEALVAASLQKPVREVAKLLESHPAVIPMQPVTASPNGYATARPVPQTTYTPPAPKPTYQPAPVAKSPVVTTPAPAPRTKYTPDTPNVDTAAAYKARREKYLASFKQKKEETKKAREVSKASEPVVTPTKNTTSEPEVFETPEQAKTSAPAASSASIAKETDEKPEPKAKPKPKETDSFISDLLADPLGKK
ncbi:MAG: hypothetical protein JXA30_14320 [Deltaproteobacteria bacterium]|nr:hypothetical protein [Deltaproteobacteria bacterium]